MRRKKPSDKKEFQQRGIGYWSWWILLLVIAATGVIRIRLLDAPLERDEGEYAYAGQLILQGVPPYAQVYNMKMPGIYAAYALTLAVFGQTQTGIHLGLLAVNAITIVLVFLLAKELFDHFIAIVTAAVFALLSLGQVVQGIYANAEHFVIFFAISGIWLLFRAVENQRWLSLLTGAILIGAAFIMKQHGAVFIAFGGLYLFLYEVRRRPFVLTHFIGRGALFLIGILLPFIITCLVLWWADVFEKFWFWTFNYAWKYVSRLSLADGWRQLKAAITQVGGSAVLLWILAAIGLFALWRNRKIRHRRFFVMGFVLFSILAVCPGLYFRAHYFILLLPAIALLVGILAGSIRDICAKGQTAFITKIMPTLLVLLVLFQATYQQRNYFFVMSPKTVTRTTYGPNPFLESVEIGQFIKEHSEKNDRIAVVGSEPQIYFYANRRSATGFIYTYALMEEHSYALQMQKEMIKEIENARPEFMVFANISTSWMVSPYSKKLILKWFNQYQEKYYRKVGVIDIISNEETVYLWGQYSMEYSPQSEFWLAVFQRKE